MAKSKLVKMNKVIEEAVVDGYKKVESTVVNGYEKIENTFVDQFLSHEGESVAATKERLKKNLKK